MADACFSSSLDNFGPGAYFMLCKHHQKIGGHMLMTKIGRLCRLVRPICTNRSDRSRWLCQNANWNSPLHSSRRDKRNAYVERPIWSSDERVMASERLDTGSDRSDRSGRPVRPVQTVQSGFGVVFWCGICIELDSWWGKTSPPYKYKGPRPIEDHPIDQTQKLLSFYFLLP